jgi:hypothetical protein
MKNEFTGCGPFLHDDPRNRRRSTAAGPRSTSAAGATTSCCCRSFPSGRSTKSRSESTDHIASRGVSTRPRAVEAPHDAPARTRCRPVRTGSIQTRAYEVAKGTASLRRCYRRIRLHCLRSAGSVPSAAPFAALDRHCAAILGLPRAAAAAPSQSLQALQLSPRAPSRLPHRESHGFP